MSLAHLCWQWPGPSGFLRYFWSRLGCVCALRSLGLGSTELASAGFIIQALIGRPPDPESRRNLIKAQCPTIVREASPWFSLKGCDLWRKVSGSMPNIEKNHHPHHHPHHHRQQLQPRDQADPDTMPSSSHIPWEGRHAAALHLFPRSLPLHLRPTSTIRSSVLRLSASRGAEPSRKSLQQHVNTRRWKLREKSILNMVSTVKHYSVVASVGSGPVACIRE